mmetsp:Transcript_6832/g.11238  ORF Transcript_6832/g.11238 Transcript_6832/m.11238 type:complete len:698 (+) Transcript_6832:73-2166(+)
MSWFGFGRKKAEKPEDKYKVQLDMLSKLGYNDRQKNVNLLTQYGGDANLVIKDYEVQKPSSRSPEQAKPSQPKPESQPQPQQPSPPKPAAAAPPQQMQAKPSKPAVEATKPTKSAAAKQPPPTAVPKKQEPVKQAAAKPAKPAADEQESKSAAASIAAKAAKMAKPQFKATVPEDLGQPVKPSKPIKMENNLYGLPASDIRQLLLNIGEATMAEILYAHSMDGNQIYHYIVVNPLLKKHNVGFADEPSFASMVHQLELSYQKHGAVDPYSRSTQKSETTEKTENDAESEEKKKDDDEQASNNSLKDNIQSLISSDVRLLVLPYHAELAERLYAHSISGGDLCKFDYDGIVFASGISKKKFSKQTWSKMVTELKLPQSEPFDMKRWQSLQNKQEGVIKMAQNVDKQMKQFQQELSKPPQQQKPPHVQKPKQQKQQKQDQKQSENEKQKQAAKGQPNGQKARKLKPQQMKQFDKIIELDKTADKFLPTNLQKLKQRQLHVLTSLHDIASIVDLAPSTIAEIEQSARKQSEREMQTYLNAGYRVLGDVHAYSANGNGEPITTEELELRQLELLQSIDKTRRRLDKLAKSKGVSLEQIMAVSEKIDDAQPMDAAAWSKLNRQFDGLFQSIADCAVRVQQTAQQYGVQLDNVDMTQFFKPMYDDLEQRQSDLIAQLTYLNDRARMINPKAIDVNEQILSSSV